MILRENNIGQKYKKASEWKSQSRITGMDLFIQRNQQPLLLQLLLHTEIRKALAAKQKIKPTQLFTNLKQATIETCSKQTFFFSCKFAVESSKQIGKTNNQISISRSGPCQLSICEPQCNVTHTERFEFKNAMETPFFLDVSMLETCRYGKALRQN